MKNPQITAFLDNWCTREPYCYLDGWQCGWLCEHTVPHVHYAGSLPVVQDRIFSGIELIDSGCVELVSRDVNDKEIVFRRLAPGEIYGFTARFCEGTAIYRVRTLKKLSVFVLSREDFICLTDINPAFKEFFYRETMVRIRQAYIRANTPASATSPSLVGRTAIPSKLKKSIAHIKAQYAEPLTLEDVATACGMSKFYYSRLFKSATGYSFKEYLNRVRIEAAKEMLQQKESNISETCYAVGYNDLSYFSRVFKRLENQPPSDYRRALHRPRK